MKTRAGRWTLVLMCLCTMAFSLWAWMRPYEWDANPAARVVVEGVEVKRDRSYFWVTVHVKSVDDAGIDVSEPVVLQVSGGRRLDPADTRLAGAPDTGYQEAWYQFWLGEKDCDGPLRMETYGATLLVKSTDGRPSLDDGESRNFTTHKW